MVFAPFWLLLRLVFSFITCRTIWTAFCIGLGVLAHRFTTALAESEKERDDKERRATETRAGPQIEAPYISRTGEEVRHRGADHWQSFGATGCAHGEPIDWQ